MIKNRLLICSIGCLLACFCLIFKPDDSHAMNPEVDWIAVHNATTNGTDVAWSTAIDGSGNVVVTGSSIGSDSLLDIVTILYDGDGNQIWLDRFDGPASLDDIPTAVATDSMGAVYVSGYSERVPGNPDMVVIKYDGAGTRLWDRRFEGDGGGGDKAAALLLDGEENVVVTGHGSRVSGKDDFCTIQYDAAGNLVWFAYYDGPEGLDDRAAALAIDGFGRVHVAGLSDTSGSGLDYATVTYDGNGNELWWAQYDSPYHMEDVPTAVGVDATGATYVTGTSATTQESTRPLTIKYDTAGDLEWAVRSDDLSVEVGIFTAVRLSVNPDGTSYITSPTFCPSYDCGATVSYAPDGTMNWTKEVGGYGISIQGDSLYVAGVLGPAGSRFDMHLFRYDTVGTLIWDASFPGTLEQAPATRNLAVDETGNARLVGTSDDNYAAASYAADGSLLWLASYDGSAPSDDYGYYVGVDAQDHIYVSGISNETSTWNVATVSYGPQGNVRWTALFDGPGVHSTDRVNGMAVDGLGNVYLVGSTQDERSGYPWAFVLRYDSSGTQRWVDYPDSGDTPVASEVVVSAEGGALVTGGSYAPYDKRDYDFVTTKYDAEGGVVWTARYAYDNGSSSSRNQAYKVVEDPFGNVLVTGKTNAYGNGMFFTTVKYDSDGNEQWASHFEEGIGDYSVPVSLVTDSFGNVFVLGTTDDGLRTIKYGPTGVLRWAARYDAVHVYPVDMDVDETGRVYVVGYMNTGDTARQDFITLQYDAFGNERWVAQYNGEEPLCADGPTDLFLDRSSGDLYVTGHSGDSLYGESQVLVTVKYDRNGNEKWVERYQGAPGENSWGLNVVLDSEQHIIVSGHRNGLGTESDYLTLRYTQCVDLDGDGYGSPASDLCLHEEADCDDSRAFVHPGAIENCLNGIDDDCDGMVDAEDPGCSTPGWGAQQTAHVGGPGSQGDDSKGLGVLGGFLLPAAVILFLARKRSMTRRPRH